MNHSSDKKCLVILGMHRSGTSALSGALNLAGYNPGKELFVPEEDNPKGNFENARITMLNEQILDELYSTWYDTLLIPDNWWEFSHFDNYLEQIMQILREEYATGAPVLIKDPRLSVLLPLYQKAFEALKISPGYVICFRNPLEITSSLIKRDHLSKEKSLLLWMDYQFKAEYFTRNSRRIFLSYQEFLDRPIECLETLRDRVADEIRLNEDTTAGILSFLDRNLKHHNTGGESPDSEASPELQELFQNLHNTSLRDLDQEELGIMDRLRIQFNETLRFYNGLGDTFEAMLICHPVEGKPEWQKSPVKYGKNQLVFQPGLTSPVEKLVFKPSNSRVGIKIHRIEIIDPQDNPIRPEELKTNAGVDAEENTFVFDKEMPEIIIELPSPTGIQEVRLILSYLSFGDTVYHMGESLKKAFYEGKIKSLEDHSMAVNNKIGELEKEIKGKQDEILKAQDEIHAREVELNARQDELATKNEELRLKNDQLTRKQEKLREAKSTIRKGEHRIETLDRKNKRLTSEILIMENSITWKAGRVITYPARIIYELLRPSKNKK